MRILQVNKFVYRRGGAEGYMLDLADLLRDEGHEVEFFGMQHPRNQRCTYERHFPTEVAFDEDGAGPRERARALGRMFWSTSTRRGIDAVIDDFRPDVVHAHNIYHQLSPSVLFPGHRRGIPTVLTAHDYKLVCPTYHLYSHGKPCEACLPRRFHRAFGERCRDGSALASGVMATELAVHTATRAYRTVDLFLCPSEFLRSKLELGGIDRRRLRVLRNFTDPGTLVAPTRAGAGDGFLYAGRLVEEKGVELAVRATAAAGPDVRLRIVGEGPDEARLRGLADELAPGQVEFLGWKTRAEVAGLLGESRAALVPSLWYENQPLAVLEAFSTRTPVIATALGGVPEIVRPGETGLLAGTGDVATFAAAMRTLQDDPAAALTLGEGAAAYVASAHGAARHVRDLLALYAEAGAAVGDATGDKR
jgi:glycosyltransferase involved in cell wall biosynthesis